MRSVTLVTAAVIALATAGADAGEPAPVGVVPPRARSLAERGRAFHDARDYDRAIAAYKEAYVMAPSPGLLFNLAQAYRLSGHCDDAVLMYRRYLATRPADDERAVAAGHLASVERCQHARGRARPLAASALGPRPAGAAPAHRAGDRPARPGAITRDIGLGVALGGLVAVVAAAGYAYDAHATSREIEEAYAAGRKWKDVAELDARGARSEERATWLGVGGGLAVGSGLTLYVLGKRAERLAPVRITPTAGGAEVSAAWRF